MSVRKIIALFLGLAVVGVILIGAAAVVFYAGIKRLDGQVSARVDELFTAIEEGSFSNTYASHASSEFRHAVSQEQYNAIGDAVASQLGKLESKKGSRLALSQSNTMPFVDATYRAEFEKGEATIVVRLRDQGNEWLFDKIIVNSPLLNEFAATRQCPTCKTLSKADAEFCSSCGKPLKE